MILDTGTIIAVLIAIITPCIVLMYTVTENVALRRYITELLKEDELTAEEDGE
jgi:hypothetical protein